MIIILIIISNKNQDHMIFFITYVSNYILFTGDDSSNFFRSLGRKNSIVSTEWSKLNVLDLLYDLTPHEFVSVVITEKEMLLSTSVPAILRVRETN